MAGAADYHIGEGLMVGPINLAGYASVVAEAPHDEPARLMLDDLSLYVTGRVNTYVNPFFEAELTEGALWRQRGRPLADLSPSFVLERLYNESHLGNGFSVRVGKMLTPVGEWNTIHAAPLVWTISQPMTTYRGFNEYTSGLALSYAPASPRQPETQLYWQPDGELVPKPDTLVVREYVRAGGVHLNWPLGLNDKIGLSLQHARVRGADEAQTLAGVNLSTTMGRLQLESEATHARLSGSNPARVRAREWGVYVLGAYGVTDQLSVLARVEHFADRATVRGSHNTLLGLTWRPDPAQAWKVEYIKNRGAVLNIKSGWHASFSVLF